MLSMHAMLLLNFNHWRKYTCTGSFAVYGRRALYCLRWFTLLFTVAEAAFSFSVAKFGGQPKLLSGDFWWIERKNNQQVHMSDAPRAAAMRQQMSTYGAGAKRRSLGVKPGRGRRSSSRDKSAVDAQMEEQQRRLEEVVWLCYTLEDPVALECGSAAGFPEEVIR
jgi:hypothetical protein